MADQSSRSVQEAIDHCERLTRAHYENFPVASRLLPARVRPAIFSIYAFARTADDFADEGEVTKEERLARLDEWGGKLKKCYRGAATDPIFIALAETVASRGIPSKPLEDLLAAFRMDVTKSRYNTFDEVQYYCAHSANPVGRLILQIFGYVNEENVARSDEFCTALQLANFWQDVSIDARKSRVYIPLDDISRFGYTETELFARVFNERFRELMKFQVERTEAMLQRAKPLVSKVGRDLRLELGLTWNGGMTILNKIRRLNYEVLSHRPSITKLDAVPLFLKSILGL
ncbi:MAG TPA: squalene synthase HpnC [Bacteroidota bacterium]